MNEKALYINECVGGHLIPNQMRYQAAPRSELICYQSLGCGSGIPTLAFCTTTRTITTEFTGVSIDEICPNATLFFDYFQKPLLPTVDVIDGT